MAEAAFFDRDDTLCHNDEREERFRDECISTRDRKCRRRYVH